MVVFEVKISKQCRDQFYVPPLPASIPELKVRFRTPIEFTTVGMLQTVWNEIDYRVVVRYVIKSWSVVLLNKKYIYSYLKCIVYDKL